MEGVGDHHPDRGQRNLLRKLACFNEAAKKPVAKLEGRIVEGERERGAG